MLVLQYPEIINKILLFINIVVKNVFNVVALIHLTQNPLISALELSKGYVYYYAAKLNFKAVRDFTISNIAKNYLKTGIDKRIKGNNNS